MRRIVNGDEVELSDVPLDVTHLSDRLLVHTPKGIHSALVVRQGDAVLISYRGRQFKVERPGSKPRRTETVGTGQLLAPMPGLIVAVQVAEGDRVQKGHAVLVLEAMKTQQVFAAPFDSIVEKMHVKVGAQVSEGQLLAFLTKAADNPDRAGE